MFNHFFSSLRNNRPLFFVGRLPVSMVVLLIGIHLLFMIMNAALMSLGHSSWVNILCYNSNAVWQGQVLRLVTYAFVNSPSIWFALEMLMLYYFGSEVERFIGGKKFALLYGGLVLLGSCSLQLLSLIGVPGRMSGGQLVNFAIFAAFVAIYPGLPFLFGIAARWILVAFLSLSVLQFLEARQFTSMMIFVIQSLGAIFFMIALGYRGLLPDSLLLVLLKGPRSFPFFYKRNKASSSIPVKSSHARPATTSNSSSQSLIEACSTTTSFVPVFTDQQSYEKKTTPPHVPAINIDAILEKISQTGLESLTLHEKKELEKASSALVERDRSLYTRHE